MKKAAKGVSGVLCALAALLRVIALLMTSVQLVGQSKGYFTRAHEKLNTAEKIGVSAADFDLISDAVMDYLQGDRDDLDVQATFAGQMQEVFTDAEKLHLVDTYMLLRSVAAVRDWCALGFAVCMLAAYLLRGNGFTKYCAKTVLIVSFCTAVVLAVLTMLVGAGKAAPAQDAVVLAQLLSNTYLSVLIRDITLIFAAGVFAVCVACALVLFAGKKGETHAV